MLLSITMYLAKHIVMTELHDEMGIAFLYVSVNYRQTSNISHILVGNKIVDQSDVVGLNTWLQWIGQKASARRDGKHLSFGI